MSVYLITFSVFMLVIAGMSIGYIVQRKTISGSCGGLGSIGIEKECDCPEPCDARKKREARAAKAEEWKKNQIL
ncbi:(Na+)-NQR maturation NqrM [Enterovibrio norvegicus]|uniref:(Na+)-NQR maturation NqrM n=2 Tax=Enterovibrio norvegicus TaxID=188144 RepID=A0A2N7LHY0_9GAMM|nr:(Na+)-NQR maturation NqrM [Enterovibrio norvegicus]MCC4799963.1 (Na+)-NQR maturation NqrM [Enterovibrio norvegicus]OEE44421.1 Na(+)-translocating NADH-quinone reductase subunit E [Enterovibrio norvegicus]OEF55005.1 Na(+)-translocating NADH-quinone reductase subunit E [Enterovibrio norvegicus]OEF65106.1 Na(+)-translocating NADH-quinone reductase subunit E [Enterovibrio norvegicus]PMH61841.1 Na(+)-translocating NADH-quinone reductase subunit E [Enterovibrio norvegicus]